LDLFQSYYRNPADGTARNWTSGKCDTANAARFDLRNIWLHQAMPAVDHDQVVALQIQDVDEWIAARHLGVETGMRLCELEG
jgi:hypothetical protein